MCFVLLHDPGFVLFYNTTLVSLYLLYTTLQLLFHCCKQKLLQHADIRNTLVTRLVIHTYILTNGSKIVRRLCLGLHVEKSKLLMAMAEHAISLLVRRRNSSLNTKELAFKSVDDKQTASRNVKPS